MKLFTFLLRKKTTAYFSLSGNWKEELGDLIMAVILILTGLSLGILTNYFVAQHNSRLNPAMLQRAVKFTVLLSPLFLKLFPSFTLKRTFIGAEYPLSKSTVAFLDLFAMSLYRTRNAIFVLYLLSYCSIVNNITITTVSSLFLLLFTGFMLVENIINAISWKKYFYLIITCGAAAAQYFLFDTWWVSLAVVILQFSLYFLYYERNYEGKASSGKPYKRKTGNLHWALLINNKQAMMVLLIGIGFKLLIMLTFLFMKDRTMYMIMDRVPFILCLIMPIILFSYVFNNIWGYFYEVALNNLIIQTSPGTYIKMYLELLFPALIADAILTFILLGVANVIEVKILLAYAVFAVFSIAIGIISSFTKYSPVPVAFSFTQFRAKTSRRYNFLLIIPAMAAGIVYNYTWMLYGLLGLVLLSGIGLWVYINKNMDHCSLKLKQDFFS